MIRTEQAREIARRLETTANPVMDQIAEAITLFAPLGWAMCERWNLAGTLRIVHLAGDGATADDIDAAITDLWNTKGLTFLKQAATPMRKWANAHYPFKQVIWDRVQLIEKAVQHHLNTDYEASIPILLSQIDGISFDLTGKSFFSKKNGDPFVDDSTLAGMETNLPIVRRVFSQDVKESGVFGMPSRHGVLHGRDLGYATLTNSTKTLVLVAALAEYFPRLADAKGALFRQLHETQVAGAKGLDALGRLVDDRRVPELQRFTYEFDSEYLKSVLLTARSFEASHTVSNLAKRFDLDATDFQVGQDGVGCWWHYRLPAGHILGYAARPTTSDKRRHPDVWRWDSDRAPDVPPWEDMQGWRSDDDFPRSPNWEPHAVI